jgi:hypothetical protein
MMIPTAFSLSWAVFPRSVSELIVGLGAPMAWASMPTQVLRAPLSFAWSSHGQALGPLDALLAVISAGVGGGVYVKNATEQKVPPRLRRNYAKFQQIIEY